MHRILISLIDRPILSLKNKNLNYMQIKLRESIIFKKNMDIP